MKNLLLYSLLFLILIHPTNILFAQSKEFNDTVYYDDGSIKIIDYSYFKMIKQLSPINSKDQINTQLQYNLCKDSLLSQNDTIIGKFKVIDIIKHKDAYKMSKRKLEKIDCYIITLHQLDTLNKRFKLIIFADSTDSNLNYKIDDCYDMKMKSLFSCDFSNFELSLYWDFVYKRYLIRNLCMMYMNLYVKL